VFKLKLIIRASINSLGGSSTSSPLYSKINWLIWLLSLFLGMPYRPTSFLTAHEALLAGLSTGVYFYTGVAIGVMGRT